MHYCNRRAELARSVCCNVLRGSLPERLVTGAAVGEANAFHVSWPTAESGPMNLEGAVTLGFAKELAKARAKGGAEAERAAYDRLLGLGYERAQALSVARTLETDDVIDPAESRLWIIGALEASASARARNGEDGSTAGRSFKRCVNPW